MFNFIYEMSPIIIVAIVVLLIIVIVGIVMVTKGGYTEHPGVDSQNGDIELRDDLSGNVEGLKEACDAIERCRGFNKGGWLKHTIKPESEWKSYPDDDDVMLYIKK
jgi:hypothetical protein